MSEQQRASRNIEPVDQQMGEKKIFFIGREEPGATGREMPNVRRLQSAFTRWRIGSRKAHRFREKQFRTKTKCQSIEVF